MLNQIIFFALLSLILLSLTEFREELKAFYFNKIKWQTPTSRKDFFKYHNTLKSKFPYYEALTPDGKAKFVNRLVDFLDTKDFIGKNGLKINDEMRILISASAIQLTFGLGKYQLHSLNTIIIYPKRFYSDVVGNLIKGGATESGIVFLSWEDFLDGYQFPHDTVNLGLHEMAHALKIDVLNGRNIDENFSFYIDDWMDLIESEFQALRKAKKSFIRSYGKLNKEEFYAVCVEYFFEVPLQFKEKLPDVYNHLCFLLNQDPCNFSSDYKLTPDFTEKINADQQLRPIPEKLKKSFYYNRWHWTSTIILLGMFVGSVAVYFLSKYTLITTWEIFRIAIIGAFLTTVCQFHYLFFNNIYSLKGFLIYLGIGATPLICASFLGINYLLKSNYKTESFEVKNLSHNSWNIVIILQDNEYDVNLKIRSFDYDEYTYFKYPSKPKSFTVETAEGFLGYTVIASRKLE